MERKTMIYPDDRITVTTEKQMSAISTIQRGLGIIEGVASGLANDAVSQRLYTATEMINEAVEEITNGK